MNTPSSLDTNPNQLVRHSVRLANMNGPESIGTVRTLLMQHQLLVDQIELGEATVASTSGSDPDWETITRDLKQAGYDVVDVTTVEQ